MLQTLGRQCIRAVRSSELLRRFGRNLKLSTAVVDMSHECSVCGVTVTSEWNLQQHFSGRPHLKRLEKLRCSERSVYIRGFSSDITSEVLKQFLEDKVGCVHTLWLSDKSTYALVEFKEMDDALKAVRMSKVTLSGNKLVIKPRVLSSQRMLSASEPQPPPQLSPPGRRQGSGPQRSPSGRRQGSGKGRPKCADISIDVQDILQSSELGDQLVRLSKADTIPMPVLEDHLDVTFQLLKEVRQRYPHCVLVPFGSIITGLATKHSDCDLCLLPHPPAALVHLLTGTTYFSPPLLSIVERLETKYSVPLQPPAMSSGPPATPPSPSPPTSAIREGAPLTSSLSRSERASAFGPMLKTLYGHVQKIDGCSRILSLPNARCPILRFAHDPTKLDFDVCIENVLGPLNTRLIKAYCDFDQRVPVLLSVMKLWSRSLGLSGTKLNSYALTLMVIYFLQHCDPPVLPCLQTPLRWPLNPAWYKEEKFNTQIPLERKWTAPWTVTFTAPGSLLPSTNRDSAVTLLLKFFKFYTEQFDFCKHVVSIHAPMLTRDGAVEKVVAVGREPAMRYFYGVPLVVQDPFDLEHNVSKLVNRGVFMRLQAGFKNSHAVLQRELEKDSQPSILAILDHPSDSGRESSSLHSRQLEFTLSDVRNLMLQRGVTLKDRLEELKLPETSSGLEQLVLGEVVYALTSNFMFEESSEVDPQVDEGGCEVAPGEGWREEVIAEEVEDRETSGEMIGKGAEAMREREGSREEEEDMDASAGGGGDGGEGGGEGGDGREGGGEEEAMEVEGLLTEEEGVVVKRKRMLSEQDQPEVPLIHKKHCKFSISGDKEPHPLSSTEPRPHSYVCTAYQNTWTGTRKARRQLLHSPQSTGGLHPKTSPSLQGSMSSLGAVQQPHPLPSDTAPLLQLRVTLEALPPVSWQQESVCVKIALLQGSKGDFYEFLVVLKKALFSRQTQEKQIGMLDK